ncbi:hypothetical protein BSNK01_20570 [Bacillaceae bacterium]
MASTEEKAYSKTEWLFYIIILPLAFTLMLTLILLQMLGYNMAGTLLDLGNKIPYVEKLIPDRATEAGAATADEDDDPDILKEKLALADRTIVEQRKQIDQLQEKISERESEIQRLEAELAKMKQDMQQKTEQEAQQEREKDLKELSALYASMSPSKAAPILENLTLEEALLVLRAMDNEARADILEKMDPRRAADLSILLKDSELSKSADIAALQKRIQALTIRLSEREKNAAQSGGEKPASAGTLARTLSAMPAASAAAIMEQMMETNPKQAMAIMASLDDRARSQILAQIAQNDPKTAAQLTQLLR